MPEVDVGNRSQAVADHGEHRRRWLWLLVLPFAGLLVPPAYAFDRPTVIGIPFFYWYQILWLLITALITTAVYRVNR